jgi:hypothetical protein
VANAVPAPSLVVLWIIGRGIKVVLANFSPEELELYISMIPSSKSSNYEVRTLAFILQSVIVLYSIEVNGSDQYVVIAVAIGCLVLTLLDIAIDVLTIRTSAAVSGTISVSGAWFLVRSYPSENRCRKLLARLYARDGDHKKAIQGWKELSMAHPQNDAIRMKLAEAYGSARDYNEAISISLEIWKRKPWSVSRLAVFRGHCYRRHPMKREINLLRFAIVCALSIFSSKFVQVGSDRFNWWPLANENEIMMVRSYMCKQEWCSVSFVP